MSLVSVVKCPNYAYKEVYDGLVNTFNNLGGVEIFIKPGMKVLLKTNLVMKKGKDDPTITNPLFLKVLADIIIKSGGKVVVIDSPGGPYTVQELKGIYSACGLTSYALKSGFELNYDLSVMEIENPDGKLLRRLTVLKPLVEADVVINVPKLKTHGQMVYTGAVKNMFGAIPGELKAEYHFKMQNYDEFANCLIDIFLSVKPTLNIMDAIIGMEGDGPSAGEPRNIGVIIGSQDGFSLDRVAINIINGKVIDIPIMRNAVERGIFKEVDSLETVGEDYKDYVIKDFIIPKQDELLDYQFVQGSLLKFLIEKAKPKPIIMHTKCVGCGDCAKRCPPHAIDMKDKKPNIKLSGCIRCFCCQELCPAKAIKIKRPIFMKIILKYASILKVKINR